jgi:hypothetical protein
MTGTEVVGMTESSVMTAVTRAAGVTSYTRFSRHRLFCVRQFSRGINNIKKNMATSIVSMATSIVSPDPADQYLFGLLDLDPDVKIRRSGSLLFIKKNSN